MPHVLAVLAASLCFATTGTAQALAALDASPVAVGAARGLVGGALLAVIAWIARRKSAEGASWFDAVRDAPMPIVLGVLGVLAYNFLFFAGTAANGVAVGTVVAVGSAPIAAGIFESLVLRSAPPPRWVAATGVAITGVALVSGLIGVEPASQSVTLPGLALSIGAGCAYALTTVASKLLFARGWSGTTTMGTMFGFSGLAALPILLVMDTSWMWSSRGMALTAWLGIITVAVAYSLWAWGLSALRSTTVTTLTLAEPMGATVLGLVVLHETLTAPAALGIALVAAGLVIVARPARTIQASSVTVTETKSSEESGPV